MIQGLLKTCGATCDATLQCAGTLTCQTSSNTCNCASRGTGPKYCQCPTGQYYSASTCGNFKFKICSKLKLVYLIIKFKFKVAIGGSGAACRLDCECLSAQLLICSDARVCDCAAGSAYSTTNSICGEFDFNYNFNQTGIYYFLNNI
jgi:hypothetical protein